MTDFSCPAKCNRTVALAVALAGMTALILLTRLVALTHNMQLHIDEPTFYGSASSIFSGGGVYSPAKPYPEGAFLLFIPFQALGKLLCAWLGIAPNPQLFNRVASVLYFTAGSLLGCALLQHGLQKPLAAVVVFALTMVFALFQIEQSRYGTGDNISFFLMMLALRLMQLYFSRNQTGWLLAAAFVLGVLGSVKYPQLFFAVLPFVAFALNRKGARKACPGLLLLFTALGFLLFSPSILTNSSFLQELLGLELGAWTDSPKAAAPPWSHLLCLLIYHMVYSDLPLAPVFAVYALFCARKTAKEPSGRFFTYAVPICFAAFFVANLFVPLMFFRTFTLCFSVAALYAACGTARLLSHSKGRAVVAALCCLMALRGSMLVYTLATDSATVMDKLQKHPQYTEQSASIVTGPYMPGGRPGNVTVYELNNFLFDDVPVEDYDFAVIGPYDYCRARSALFTRFGYPRMQKLASQWQSFQAYYEPELFAKMYPDHYYGLYGFWLYGSSATEFEFPPLYFYHMNRSTQ